MRGTVGGTYRSFSGRGGQAVVRGRRRRSDNGRHKAWRERLHHQRYRPSSHGESDTIEAAGPHDLSAPYATDTRQIWGSALTFGFAFRGGDGGSRSRRRHADRKRGGSGKRAKVGVDLGGCG